METIATVAYRSRSFEVASCLASSMTNENVELGKNCCSFESSYSLVEFSKLLLADFD